MSSTLITSRDPKGLHIIGLCEVVLNKAKLDEDRAQCVIEHGGELQSGLKNLIEQLSVSNRYAAEEIKSNYRYPKGYKGPKPLSQQIDALAKIFGLSLGYTSEFVEKVLPTLTLSDGAEGWFAIPSIDALAARFFPEAKNPKERLCVVSNLVLTKIGESRAFTNYREGQLTPDRFRLNARTAEKFSLLTEQQKGDIWIVGASFGKRHAGRSVRRAREVMVGPEFGAYTVAVGSMLLTHPERLVSYDDLWMDVPGDEFDPAADGGFGGAPYLGFFVGGVEFAAYWVARPSDRCGSVSLFLPQ